jgi:hypothetical protein
MRAYKFLCAGAVGPFSRYAWPLPRDGRPGAWVIAPSGAGLCRGAVHGCRVADLPWWLQDELWAAELDGPVAAGRHKVMAPRGRLLHRVEGWDAACAQRFADACAWRARDHAARALERDGAAGAAAELRAAGTLGEVRDQVQRMAAANGSRRAVAMAGDGAKRALMAAPVTAAYIAAHVAARVDGAAALGAERAWQAEWLRSKLGLPPDRPVP